MSRLPFPICTASRAQEDGGLAVSLWGGPKGLPSACWWPRRRRTGAAEGVGGARALRAEHELKELITDRGDPFVGRCVSARTFVSTWRAQSDVTALGLGGGALSETPARSVRWPGCSGRGHPLCLRGGDGIWLLKSETGLSKDRPKSEGKRNSHLLAVCSNGGCKRPNLL